MVRSPELLQALDFSKPTMRGPHAGSDGGDNFAEYGCVRRRSSGLLHVLLRLRVPKHCLEIYRTSPLSIVHHASAVETPMNIGGHEPLLMTDCFLCGTIQQIHQRLLPRGVYLENVDQGKDRAPGQLSFSLRHLLSTAFYPLKTCGPAKSAGPSLRHRAQGRQEPAAHRSHRSH